MKYIKQLVAFIIPLMVSVFVYYQFNQPDTNQPTVIDVKIDEADKKKEALKNWLESKKVLLNDEFFKNLKIKHDDKEIKFENLDETKKLVFKIMLLSKAKRDLENSTFVKEVADESRLEIKKTMELVDEMAKKQKESLYNIYGSKMHPQDKLFLEKIDVHLFK